MSAIDFSTSHIFSYSSELCASSLVVRVKAPLMSWSDRTVIKRISRIPRPTRTISLLCIFIGCFFLRLLHLQQPQTTYFACIPPRQLNNTTNGPCSPEGRCHEYGFRVHGARYTMHFAKKITMNLALCAFYVWGSIDPCQNVCPILKWNSPELSPGRRCIFWP